MGESIKFGYIRTSTKQQSYNRQIKELEENGVKPEHLYIDQQTGANFEREAYKNLKANLRRGDIVYVCEFDRIGRNYTAVIAEYKSIVYELGADIIALDNNVINSKAFREQGDIGRLLEDLFLSVMAYVAQSELKKNHERQAKGIEAAKAAGKRLGRPLNNTEFTQTCFKEVYDLWEEKQITGIAAAKTLGVAPSTFYRYVKQKVSKLVS